MVLSGAAQGQVQAEPRATLIAQANAARDAGDFTEAITVLERARVAYPNDPEILRLLGTSYAFNKRYAEGTAALSRARDLAPDDLDIRAALARALYWSGRKHEAMDELAAIEARDARNTDAAALRRQIADTAATGGQATRRGGIALSQSLSGVSFRNGIDRTWWTAGASAYVTAARGTTLSAEIEREERGRLIDTHLLARVDHAFSSDFRGYLAFAATPAADFREKWSIRAGIESELTAGLTLLVDARRSGYGAAKITVLEPGARVAVAPLRGSVTLRMINLWDEADTHRTGWSARVDGELGGRALLFGGAATYPDTEAGVTRRVRAAFVGLQLPLGEHWAVRLTGDYERRVDTYTRKGATLGAQLRF